LLDLTCEIYVLRFGFLIFSQFQASVFFLLFQTNCNVPLFLIFSLETHFFIRRSGRFSVKLFDR